MCHSTRERGFTLVELLVVVGIIAVLIGLLLPALSHARRAANTAKCLANMRNMELAHTMFVNEHKGRMIQAGLAHSTVPGSHDPEMSWIKTLQVYFQVALAHRCPSDESPYWDEPLPGSTPPMFRGTSFGINNYVDPGHAPAGVGPYVKITQVKQSSRVVHFIEVVEAGNYATSDHIHVELFHNPFSPHLNPVRAANQLATSRHGGRRGAWEATANYGFLDGHAETLRFRDVYLDANENSFDPAVVR